MKAKIICTTVLVEKSPQALPLGAACIASALKKDSRTADFCDVELISFYPEDTEDYIVNKLLNSESSTNSTPTQSSSTPTLICFSVFVWNRKVLEKVAARLHSKQVICIAGGPEVTACPDSFSTFDYLITGPGEEKVPELVSRILKFPTENTMLTNKSDFLNWSPYLDGTLSPKEYGGVLWELARGCPFKCSYCYESKGEKVIKRFSTERINSELELFAKQKVSQVFVLDPTYNANKQQALELLKLIAKKTPDTFYYFEARAEFIDRQLAFAFTKIPCALQIGLQSSNENVLKLVNRPFNKKQFLQGINFLNEAGTIFGLDLIYGLPGDTFASFKQSIDFAISVYPNNLEIFCLSVLPGTDLYDKAQEFKLNFQNEAPYHIINTDKFSQSDLKQAERLAHACSFFYNDGRAVPWFNTICHLLHQKPSQFFTNFAVSYEDEKLKDFCSCHEKIEKIQIEFISNQLKQKHLEKYIRLATDLIKFNGAISRTQDTGKSEKVTLIYPAEYLDSEYSTDLQYFLSNVKQKQNTVTTFRQNNQTYWK